MFVAAQTPTNIKRYVRHPQMLGTALWAFAHLMVNGDIRSVLLFGAFLAWSLLEIVLCNRRDGAWQRPEPKPRKWDVITVAIGAVAFVTLVYLHPVLFGVPASPYV